ncbi:lysozyme [Yersinia ruckeri]|uniref:Lysozyme n=2 Tax=Yersinia ruckeri TaxID=29486 RepID=A0A380QKM2_YERRU|nr:lysozyme [Yersinia ruckeri]KGA49783.1 phage lysozyme family protein [Yersinia ruckeri ATCC 29473]ARZ01126.1 phage lysozyme [Yersinia ruckeri]AUQ43198.1 lysozyme [Yersinia ruckeri]EKN3344866.1 lysozyme [Yersinia ruckeri]
MYRMISETGFELIMSFESLSLESYQDSNGIWNIGYSHSDNVIQGQKIEELTAMSLLQSDIMICEECLNNIVAVPLNQNQFDALVSFLFNVGVGHPGVKSGFQYLKSGQPSNMLININKGNFVDAADEFSYWIYMGSIRSPSLVKRREKEMKLFMTKEA